VFNVVELTIRLHESRHCQSRSVRDEQVEGVLGYRDDRCGEFLRLVQMVGRSFQASSTPPPSSNIMSLPQMAISIISRRVHQLTISAVSSIPS
jgi:hypothetical protein